MPASLLTPPDRRHDDEPPHARDPLAARPVDDPAQESLQQALRAGFNALRLVLLVLLVAYFASGWFQVRPGEQGLISRFGKLRINSDPQSQHAGSPIFDQGWHFALPDPFDEKIRISGQPTTIYLDTFLFQRDPREVGKPLGARTLAETVPSRTTLTPGADGTMLSGDRNLSHGLWTIEYRIVDAAQFVRNVGNVPADFEPLLRRLAENVILRTVAGRRVEEILKYSTAGEQSADVVADEVRSRLRRELEALGTGVELDKVASDTIEPGAVRQAFLAVSEAENERKRLIAEAETTRNQLFTQAAGPGARELLKAVEAYGAAQSLGSEPDQLAGLRSEIDRQLAAASGEAAETLARAQTRATAHREQLQSELRDFQAYREAYRAAPRATALGLWTGMLESVLSSRQNEVIRIPSASVIEIHTNRDPQRAREAEMERYRTGRP
jgi:regulator of protease activity HflC (stomatin/prohibitin superfamily)